MLVQPQSDYRVSLMLVSISVSVLPSAILELSGRFFFFLDFSQSSQKLRQGLFSWETWKIRIGVYIPHFVTLNLKEQISPGEIKPKFFFHPVSCVVHWHDVTQEQPSLWFSNSALQRALALWYNCRTHGERFNRSFTACGVDYPVILPLLVARRWAVKISTTLRMWVQT